MPPKPAGETPALRCRCRRFMAPMRDAGIVEAFHQPPLTRPSATLSPPCGERAGRGVPIWFMVPMHAKKRKEAAHEREGRMLQGGGQSFARPPVFGGGHVPFPILLVS